MSNFDPYYHWLQIPPTERPINLYRLLGVKLFEPNLEVIKHAGRQRLLQLQAVQNGPNGPLAEKLINEIKKAGSTLLNVETKKVYDSQLQARVNSPGPHGTQPSTTTPLAPQQPAQLNPNPGLGSPEAGAFPQGYTTQGYQPQATQPQFNQMQPAQLQPQQLGAYGATGYKQQNPKPSWLLPSLIGGGVLIVAIVIVAIVVATSGKSNDAKNENSRIANNESGKDKSEKVGAKPQSKAKEKTIEMIPLLKVPENLLQGDASVRGGTVRLESETCVNMVNFPLYLPAEYEIEATVTRVSPFDGFGIGLHVGGQPCCLMVDGFPNSGWLTGLRQINQYDIDSGRIRRDVKSGQQFKVNRPTHIKVTVTPRKVELLVDYEVVYTWIGNLNTVKQSRHFLPGDSVHQLWLMSWKTQFDISDLKLTFGDETIAQSNWFERAQVKEPSESIGPEVDLLKDFMLSNVINSPVVNVGNKLSIGPGKLAGLKIPNELPEEFDVQLTVQKKGPEGLAIILPYHRRRFALIIEQLIDGKYRTGIQNINGVDWFGGVHPGFKGQQLLTENRSANVVCKIRRDSVRLFVDGRLAYGWTGNSGRVSSPDWPKFTPTYGSRVMELAGLSNSLVIERLTFKRVTVSGRPNDESEMLARLIEVHPPIGRHRAKAGQ